MFESSRLPLCTTNFQKLYKSFANTPVALAGKHICMYVYTYRYHTHTKNISCSLQWQLCSPDWRAPRTAGGRVLLARTHTPLTSQPVRQLLCHPLRYQFSCGWGVVRVGRNVKNAIQQRALTKFRTIQIVFLFCSAFAGRTFKKLTVFRRASGLK